MGISIAFPCNSTSQAAEYHQMHWTRSADSSLYYCEAASVLLSADKKLARDVRSENESGSLAHSFRILGFLLAPSTHE